MAFLLKGARVVDPQLNLDAVLDVRIDGETIAEVAATVAPQEGDTVIDAKGKVLTPGLVDMHVHFRDPGFEYKETIETGSRAAVHGGFTDVATMPNTNPVTDNGPAVRFQIDRGNEVGLIHVRPMGAPRALRDKSLLRLVTWLMRGHPRSLTTATAFKALV